MCVEEGKISYKAPDTTASDVLTTGEPDEVETQGAYSKAEGRKKKVDEEKERRSRRGRKVCLKCSQWKKDREGERVVRDRFIGIELIAPLAEL